MDRETEADFISKIFRHNSDYYGRVISVRLVDEAVKGDCDLYAWVAFETTDNGKICGYDVAAAYLDVDGEIEFGHNSGYGPLEKEVVCKIIGTCHF